MAKESIVCQTCLKEIKKAPIILEERIIYPDDLPRTIKKLYFCSQKCLNEHWKKIGELHLVVQNIREKCREGLVSSEDFEELLTFNDSKEVKE